MMVMVCMTGALLLADLLRILLDVGEIGLCGGEVAGFQILRELRNGGGQRAAALRACRGREQRGLLAAGKKLLKRREIALRLGQVSGLQILPELLKALLELLLVGILGGGRTELAENCTGNSKNRHACLLFSGGFER
jgi:hypothetical protein